MVDRAAIRDNARYLRSVRPIDPEEIHEYVTGNPHPAVVRRVLREEAYDLGLCEREDGTFVPVDEDPVPLAGWEPEALPERYDRVIADLLVEHYGPGWPDGDSGDELRAAIDRLRTDYRHGNDVEYDAVAALGYAVYHLADYYAAVGYVLDDLAGAGLLPRHLRVLDVGAGVGGPALGIADYLPDDAVVDYHAVEPGPAADLLERLLAETPQTVRTTIHRERIQAHEPDGSFDLVLAANVLSELDDPIAVGRDLLNWTAADGSLVLLSPAELETASGLREVERALVPAAATADDDAPAVFSPTLRLWPGAAPADRGWSFDARPDVTPPDAARRLDAAADGDGTYRKSRVQFAYGIVRPDGRRRFDLWADPEHHASLADSDRNVTDRVDFLAVKLSDDLADGDDANPLFKIGDGSEAVDHYAVLTRESALNRELLVAPYGAVVSFENVLVLWNDDEEAYNLVLDAESVADIVAG